MSDILSLMPAFITNHLFLSVFLFLLLFGFTMPISEEIALALVGVMVRNTKGGFICAALVGLPALLLADSLYFLLARLVGPKLLRIKFLERFIKPEKVRGGELYFQRRGQRIVFLSRFVVGLRAPVILGAGLLRMRWTRFILNDGAAIVIAIPCWLAVGFALGVQLDSEVGVFGRILAILAPIAIILGSILIYRSVRADKSRAAEETRVESALNG
jgi:membrane protein DedA with SNARE-associated domain